MPVIAGGRIPAYFHNTANRTGETISIAGSGAHAGFVSYWDRPVFLSDSFSIAPNHETLITKFVFYFLQSKQRIIHGKKRGAGVPHVYAKDISNLRIPIPPIEVQREIVSILDRYDALVNDVTSGLPAEIKARRKQYEYYRNKLLTFKEAA